MSVDKETRAALDAIEDAQSEVRWWMTWAVIAVLALASSIVGCVLLAVLVGGDNGLGGAIFLGMFGGGGSAAGVLVATSEATDAQKKLRRARRRHRDLLLDGAS